MKPILIDVSHRWDPGGTTVNAIHIVGFSETDEDSTRVSFINGVTLEVKESPTKIRSKIRDATREAYR